MEKSYRQIKLNEMTKELIGCFRTHALIMSNAIRQDFKKIVGKVLREAFAGMALIDIDKGKMDSARKLSYYVITVFDPMQENLQNRFQLLQSIILKQSVNLVVKNVSIQQLQSRQKLSFMCSRDGIMLQVTVEIGDSNRFKPYLLLQKCLDVQPMFEMVLFFVKELLTKLHGIESANSSTNLCEYHVELLVISFFIRRKLIPQIQEELPKIFQATSTKTDLLQMHDWNFPYVYKPGSWNLAELLIDCVDYIDSIDYDIDVVNWNGLVRKEDWMNANNVNPKIEICDPFTGRNLTENFCPQEYWGIKTACSKVMNDLARYFQYQSFIENV